MTWQNDALGKALAIGHYLAHTSTFAPKQVVTFSSRPELHSLEGDYKSQIQGMEDMDWGEPRVPEGSKEGKFMLCIISRCAK